MYNTTEMINSLSPSEQNILSVLDTHDARPHIHNMLFSRNRKPHYHIQELRKQLVEELSELDDYVWVNEAIEDPFNNRLDIAGITGHPKTRDLRTVRIDFIANRPESLAMKFIHRAAEEDGDSQLIIAYCYPSKSVKTDETNKKTIAAINKLATKTNKTFVVHKM